MKEINRKYFTRKYVANYFDISIKTLLRVIGENRIKETYITGDKDSRGNKTVRISKNELEKLEKILNKKL